MAAAAIRSTTDQQIHLPAGGDTNMKTGLLLNADGIGAPGLPECAERAQALELDALWVPELFGREPFVTAGALLATASDLTVGTAIANVYARDPMATKAAAQTLREIHGDRFNLGLGVSNVVGNRLRGHDWQPPAAKLDAYLDAMADWQLQFPVEGSPPLYVAAHGPKLLDVAARKADGAFMYLSSTAYLRQARELLNGKELLLMQPCAVADDLDQARELARRALSIYSDLPNYQRAWRAQGFIEDDYADGPSDRLLDELAALGPLDRVLDRLSERCAAADRVILIPLNTGAGRQPDWQIVSELVEGLR
jgi:probable F420-dependent oxidoreductase